MIESAIGVGENVDLNYQHQVAQNMTVPAEGAIP
jgi:hypothetical protein